MKFIRRKSYLLFTAFFLLAFTVGASFHFHHEIKKVSDNCPVCTGVKQANKIIKPSTVTLAVFSVSYHFNSSLKQIFIPNHFLWLPVSRGPPSA